MNAIDRLQLLAELETGSCELNHGPGTRSQDYPASDYLVMPVGYQESPVIEVATRELVIPICTDCVTALLGYDWTLLYCFECCSSQWVYRKFARFDYRHHILWLRGCPECTNEFGGLYFNEYRAIADEVLFLRHDSGVLAA